VFNANHYNPWYKNGEFYDQFTALPVRVITNIEASDGWWASYGDTAQSVAQALVDQQAATLHSFVELRRQQYALSPLTYANDRIDLPGVSARYQNNTGHEYIYLTVRPEAAANPRSLDITTGGGLTIDIVKSFDFWPWPGSQKFGDPNPYLQGLQGVTIYDPVFAPTNDKGGKPALAALGAGVQPTPKDLWSYIDKKWTPSWWATSSDYSPVESYDPQLNSGYVEQLWLKNVAVGKAYSTALSGKQYWEVEVRRLPDAVPDTITQTYEGMEPAYWPSVTNPIFKQDEKYGSTRTQHLLFPQELNTFLSPVIGLVPAHFLDGETLPAKPETENPNAPVDSNTDQLYFMHKVIGLDPDVRKPRSIGAVRTSTLRGTETSSEWLRGYVSVDLGPEYANYVTDRNPRYYIFPADEYNAPFPYETPDPTAMFTPDGSLGPPLTGSLIIKGLAGGSEIYECASNRQRVAVPRSGGPVGTTGFIEWPAGSGVFWDYVGAVGGLAIGAPGSSITATQNRYQTIKHENIAYGDFTHLGRFDYETAGTDYTNQWQIWCPEDKVGKAMPVIKGRGDYLPARRSEVGTDFDNVSADGNTPLPGYDTGVDLGELVVGDRIMIATDTASRKVWFGKNGQWVGPDGGAANPEKGDGYACLMDLDTEQKTVQYHAAVSARYGPTWVRMHLGIGLVYSPPKGFGALGLSAGPTTTIPLP
jgi:hypothetical protein